jgi:hypothetical protein
MNEYRELLPRRVKRTECDADHSPAFSAKVLEYVEFYIHSPIRLHCVILRHKVHFPVAFESQLTSDCFEKAFISWLWRARGGASACYIASRPYCWSEMITTWCKFTVTYATLIRYRCWCLYPIYDGYHAGNASYCSCRVCRNVRDSFSLTTGVSHPSA